MNRGRAKLVTNRIVRSKWRSPYPFYRPSSDGTRFTATRGNMYPTHHPLCGPIIQICDHQTTNIITSSPLSSFPFTFSTDPHARSSRHVHDSTTILRRRKIRIHSQLYVSFVVPLFSISLRFFYPFLPILTRKFLYPRCFDSFMILS